MKRIVVALSFVLMASALHAESPKKSAQQENWTQDYQYGDASATSSSSSSGTPAAK